MNPDLDLYTRHISPAFMRLLGTFGYGRAFVRAEGMYVEDDQGRRYLDMLAGFGAVPLGHNPEVLKQALINALSDNPLHLNLVGPSLPAARLAARLAGLSGLPRCIFANTGSEAVEAAMKLARAATGRAGLLYMQGGFHGMGLGALSVMGHPRFQKPFLPLLPGCEAIPFDDLETAEALLKRRSYAGVILEPIQAEGGVIRPRPGYLRSLSALCRQYGTMLLLDEVQTGIGRTGTMFCFEQDGFVPDVLILGKALGGGLLPVSAILCGEEAHDRACGSPERFDLFSGTYSQYALGAAAGLCTLDAVPPLLPQIQERGALFGQTLRSALAGHPLVKEIRGRGLLWGIEFGPTNRSILGQLAPGAVRLISRQVFGQWVALRLLERGILCQPASQRWDVLRLEPSLIVTDDQIAHCVSELADILDGYRDPGSVLWEVAGRLSEQYRSRWSFR